MARGGGVVIMWGRGRGAAALPDRDAPGEVGRESGCGVSASVGTTRNGAASEDLLLRSLAVTGDAGEAVRRSARPGAGVGEMARSLAHTAAVAAGVGPILAPLLADECVTDVLVNSGQVWVDRGRGLEVADVDVGAEHDVRRLAVTMAAACGKRLDEASPIVDGTLPSGVRLHAVLPPLSASGTLISLRSYSRIPLTVDDLQRSGSLTPVVGVVVRALVDRRANILISGATGSGKTTLLGALLALIPHDQRIVCIEEVAELRPDHPHSVSLQERRANVQGAGAVSLSDLVRAALRMRPDRIVLGECRGAEVRDVLTALNTGHEGGMATIHANSARDVPARLQALGALAGMDSRAVAAQSIAALDAVIQMRKGEGVQGTPGRWVGEIGVFSDHGHDALVCVPAVSVDEQGHAEYGAGWPHLLQRLNISDDSDADIGRALSAGR
ncbi:MAG: TadA family conjugal transfer-associated ATPase [Actinomycetaceae bacterium]|nr:TadA family conjugal transfer-associated ATPase [Actinomycetaceae bacterium]